MTAETLVACHMLLLQLLSLTFPFLRLLLSVELFACELLWNSKCSSCRMECSHERALWKLTSLWKKKQNTFNQYFIHKGTRVGHDVIHLLCYVNKDFFNQNEGFSFLSWLTFDAWLSWTNTFFWTQAGEVPGWLGRMGNPCLSSDVKQKFTESANGWPAQEE